MVGGIFGLRIIYSSNALEDTEERLFPVSKNRSARIRKKLIKRYGGEFRKRPCMWRVGDVLYAHPSFKAQINAAVMHSALEPSPLFRGPTNV